MARGRQIESDTRPTNTHVVATSGYGSGIGNSAMAAGHVGPPAPAGPSPLLASASGPPGHGTCQAGPTTICLDDYLTSVSLMEQQYRADRESDYNIFQRNGLGRPSNQTLNDEFTASMRDLYNYEGGFWEAMIPDAPDVAAPSGQTPGLRNITYADGNGGRRNRDVVMPNGEIMDPGHIYTGIDAIRHPDAHIGLDLYGVNNRDGATWSGDVGSAIVDLAQSGNAQQSWDSFSGEADLHSDLDGVNIGSSWSTSDTVAGNLRSYYQGTDVNKTWHTRYSQFLDNMDYTRNGNQLTQETRDSMAGEIDSFAEAFSRRGEGTGGRLLGVVGNTFEPGDANSTAINNRFFDYMEDGLAGEPRR